MHPLGHMKSFKNNGSEPRLDIKSSGELLKVLLPRSQANQLNQNLGAALRHQQFYKTPQVVWGPAKVKNYCFRRRQGIQCTERQQSQCSVNFTQNYRRWGICKVIQLLKSLLHNLISSAFPPYTGKWMLSLFRWMQRTNLSGYLPESKYARLQLNI